MHSLPAKAMPSAYSNKLIAKALKCLEGFTLASSKAV